MFTRRFKFHKYFVYLISCSWMNYENWHFLIMLLTSMQQTFFFQHRQKLIPTNVSKFQTLILTFTLRNKNKNLFLWQDDYVWFHYFCSNRGWGILHFTMLSNHNRSQKMKYLCYLGIVKSYDQIHSVKTWA